VGLFEDNFHYFDRPETMDHLSSGLRACCLNRALASQFQGPIGQNALFRSARDENRRRSKGILSSIFSRQRGNCNSRSESIEYHNQFPLLLNYRRGDCASNPLFIGLMFERGSQTGRYRRGQHFKFRFCSSVAISIHKSSNWHVLELSSTPCYRGEHYRIWHLRQ